MSKSTVAHDLKRGDIIVYDSDPFTVISNEFNKPGKGRPVNRLKLKSIMHLGTRDVTVSPDHLFHLADVSEENCTYMYSDDDFAYLMNTSTYETESIALSLVEDIKQWFVDGLECCIVKYNSMPISVQLPLFVDLTVTETEQGTRGDTTSNKVMKKAVLETGINVMIPIFVEQGEKIKIDTRTGEYHSRAKTAVH